MTLFSPLVDLSLPRGVVVLASLLPVLHYLANRTLDARRRPFLPPGLKRWPVLGNAFNLPLSNPAEGYAEWGRKLGSDIVSATALGQTIVSINSRTIAMDLLEGRSPIYSCRIQSTMVTEVVGFDYLMLLLPMGRRWKDQRKMFQKNFKPGDLSIIHPQELHYAGRLLVRLNKEPGDFLEVIKGTIGAFIFSLSYGVPVKPRHDPFLDLAETVTRMIARMGAPGEYVVDFLPSLSSLPRWFPGACFKREAESLRHMPEQFRTPSFDYAVSHIAAGRAQPSFVSTALESLDEYDVNAEHQKQVIKDVAAMIYFAGTDTTAGQFMNWLWVTMKHPEVQARLHAEIDAVLEGRMPTFEDEEHLPYLKATIMEAMRCQPIVPAGIPHRTVEDDVYGEYFIPKHSVVIPNVWAMYRNEEDYPDPHTFHPDRFMMNGRINPAVPDPASVLFGFGRRSCPGSHIGRSMLYITCASLATIYDWFEPLGEDGKPMNQPANFATGFFAEARPFKCDFRVRSPVANTLLANLEDSLEKE